MRPPRSLVIASVAALALAGCGGDDEEERPAATTGGGTETEPAEAKGPASAKLTIRETDFKLTPSRAEVARPGVVEVVARNDGDTVHALEIEGPKGEVETSTFGPGRSDRVRVDLSEPGTYEMYCPVGNHRDLGMKGEVVVAGGSGAGATTSETQTEDESGDDKSGSGGY